MNCYFVGFDTHNDATNVVAETPQEAIELFVGQFKRPMSEVYEIRVSCRGKAVLSESLTELSFEASRHDDR